MLFDESTVEKYAMKAEEMQTTELQGWSVSVIKIGESLGLKPEDSRQIACYLRDMGWATVTFDGKCPLSLTPKGHHEIAKLRTWPGWLRWIDRNPGAIAAIALAIGIISAIAALIALLK
jgi:hypothetical protein